MSYNATDNQVMISSPSDVLEEKQITRDIIHEWNAVNSRIRKMCLLPVDWESNSSPEMSESAQAILNRQILEDSDLLIAIFWTRIGSPTGLSVSGTVEEIEKHLASGKPAMLYFSNARIHPDKLDSHQFAGLLKFKKECEARGLVETFKTTEDYRKKLQIQLPLIINRHEYFKTEEITPSYDEIKDNTNDIDIIKSLTDNEKLLLTEASEDANGTILRAHYKGGFDVVTNNKRLNKDFEPRTRALWEEVFRSLLDKDFIEPRGTKGEVFGLTNLECKIADKVKEQQSHGY
jgi:hypothetical protein